MRYYQLGTIIRKHKPKTILEIGTWNGGRAIDMCAVALNYGPVHYIGYDLFESADNDTDARELNVKRHYSLNDVTKRLFEFQDGNPEFTFELHKGDTNKTLQFHDADFVYIDGGHSIATIENDYNKTCHVPICILDDYYLQDRAGLPDITVYGCNTLIDQLTEIGKRKIKIMPKADPIKGGGFTQLVYIK